MRTITYHIADYTNEPEHGGFSIIETETLHVVTGDEQSHYDLPMFFETREAAQAEVEALLRDLAY